MNYAIRLLCAVCFLLIAASALAATPVPDYKTIPGVTPEPVTAGAGLKTPQELEAFLDGVMGAHLRAQHTAGAVVTVVKDGKLFFAKGYGYADVAKRIPVDPAKTLFRLGSTSKLFTWTALMQLIEQGKVSLDADVNTYLTQFKVPNTFPGKPITVRNLFTHTEGMEDGGMGYLSMTDPNSKETLAEGLAAHIPARVNEPATGDFSNGDMASYSNWGTGLAGLIVANVSGMSYEDYVQKFILDPLGMKDSSARRPLPPELAGQMSVGYKYKAGEYTPGEFELIYPAFIPAGSMSASGTDMATFMIAHLQNGTLGDAHILGDAAARMMHGRSLSPSPYVNGACLGFYETYVNGRRLITHAGDTMYFHSELNLLLEENVGIFVSYNSSPSDPYFSPRSDLRDEFMNRYYPANVPQLKPPEDFRQRMADYVGSYRINRHSFSKWERIMSLGIVFNVIPTDHDTLMIGMGPLLHEWVEVQPDTFRRVDNGDTLAFNRDANGKVAHMLNASALPSMQAYRLRWYETVGFIGLVIGFGLLCFLVAIVSALRHWKQDRTAPAPARQARRLAAAVGITHFLFLIFFGIAVATLMKQPLAALSAPFYIALAFPILAVPLTLALVYFVFAVWKGGYWTRYARVQYTLIVVGSAAFLWLLNFVNLIGYKIG